MLPDNPSRVFALKMPDKLIRKELGSVMKKKPYVLNKLKSEIVLVLDIIIRYSSVKFILFLSIFFYIQIVKLTS